MVPIRRALRIPFYLTNLLFLRDKWPAKPSGALTDRSVDDKRATRGNLEEAYWVDRYWEVATLLSKNDPVVFG
jgi:hypothetical protein